MVKLTFVILTLMVAIAYAFAGPSISHADRYKAQALFRSNNQAQNKSFADAIKECEGSIGYKLNKDQIQKVHREISKQGFGYHEIVEICIDLYD